MSDLPPIIQKFGINNTDYKTGAAEINRSIRVIESGFKAAAAGMGDWDKQSAGLELRIKALNNQIELQKTKVEATRKEYERIKKEKGENSKAAQDLQIKLNKETETLNKMQAELQDTATNLKNMGKEEGDTKGKTDDLDKSEDKATKSTIKLGDSLKGLLTHAKNAAGGLVDLTAKVMKLAAELAVGLAAGALAAATGIGVLIVKSGEWADMFATLSGQTGISVTRLQELDYIGKKLDVDLSTLSGSYSRMIRNMETSKGGTGAAAGAFKSLGINVTDINGNLRDSQVVFDETIAALGRIPNETERDAMAMEIFGKSAMELNPLISAGADKLKELADEANRVGAVMSEDDVEALDAFKDSSDAMGNTIKGITGHLSAAFAPALSTVIGLLNDFLANPNTQKGIENMRDGISRIANIISMAFGTENPFESISTSIEWMGTKSPILKTVGSLLGNFAGTFDRMKAGFASGGIGGMLKSLIPEGGMGGIIAELSGSIGNILGSLLTGFASKPAQLLQIGLNIIQGLGTGLIAAIPALMPVILQLLASLVSFITQMLPQLLTMGLSIIMQLALGIMQAIPQLVPVVLQMVTTFVQFLTDNLPTLIVAGIQMLVAIITGIAQALPTLIPAVVGIIPVVIETLLTNLPLLIGAALQLIVALAQGLVAAIPVLIPEIPKIITAIIDAIVVALPMIIEAAGQIILALVQGLLAAIPELVKAIPEIIQSIIDALTTEGPKILQAGKDIVAGLWQGIQDAWKQFLIDMQGIISGLPDWVKKLLKISSPSEVFADIGRNMSLGLGSGFIDSMRSVRNQIGRAVEGLAVQPNITIGAGMTMAPAYAGAGRNQQPIQIILQGAPPESETKMRRQARMIAVEFARRSS